MASLNLIHFWSAKIHIQHRKHIIIEPKREPNSLLIHKSHCSDNETLTHLLKASLGTGILSMPLAFKCSGLVFGIFATILTAFVCTHCSYILVS